MLTLEHTEQKLVKILLTPAKTCSKLYKNSELLIPLFTKERRIAPA